MVRYIVSIDQGTTSCRAIVFNKQGEVLGLGQKEFAQKFPQPGWVEHNAEEILSTQIECIKDAVSSAQVKPETIACVGLTNQRETTVVWERKTRKPVYNAIVWQCRRTMEHADRLRTKANLFREKTGLIPDAYFSGPKIKWILDNAQPAKAQVGDNALAFGNIDAWLIANLTEEGEPLTDPSNASRTMLFNINSLSWDQELLDVIGIPASMMPKVLPSNGLFGHTKKDLVGFRAPILSVLGDQQSALFGQACFKPGMFKCTYGTGSFILGNIGESAKNVNGLLTTVAWQLKDKKPIYALEGATFVAGAAIQWLRDNLGIIASSEETEKVATSISGNDGVYFVPAFVGLASPYWDSNVRGTITGLTRGTGKAHIVRAAVESMAYQIKDIAEEIEKANLNLVELRVDGGATKNDFLVQFQSDLLGIPVKRAQQLEATAWGVAALAGLTAGLMTEADLSNGWKEGKSVSPESDRAPEYTGWKAAVNGALAVSKS